MVRPQKIVIKRNLKHPHSTYRAKKVPVRLAHHAHTGRRLPFYCTSYAALFFLIAFASIFITYLSHSALAGQGTISLNGTVKGPPPEIAAKITSPQTNTHFTQGQVELEGTCLQDTYIEVFRRDIFAGAALCSSAGQFKLMITLLPGSNDVFAKTKDNFDQYGPESEHVTYYLDAPGSVTSGSAATNGSNSSLKSPQSSNTPEPNLPLVLTATSVQRGVQINHNAVIDYDISGDKPPYIISIEWDDGTPPTLTSHQGPGKFSAVHEMHQAGIRTVRISAAGSEGGNALIQTLIVVQGEGDAAANSSPSVSCLNDAAQATCLQVNEIETLVDRLLPPLSIALLMTLSFWIGERIMFIRLRTH